MYAIYKNIYEYYALCIMQWFNMKIIKSSLPSYLAMGLFKHSFFYVGGRGRVVGSQKMKDDNTNTFR